MYPEEVLRQFVAESQKIESESHIPGNRSFDDHYQCLQSIVESSKKAQPWMRAVEVHKLLMQRIEPSIAGVLRWSDDCWVGNRQMPSASLARSYFTDWEKTYGQTVASVRDDKRERFSLYAWLMCIHPFEDGNGRTGRLMHAQLCIRQHVPLHIFCDSDRIEHFKFIKTYEDTVFRKYVQGRTV